MAVEVSPIVAGDLLNSGYMMVEATYIAECAPLQDDTHSYQESLFSFNISKPCPSLDVFILNNISTVLTDDCGQLLASYYDWDAQRTLKE